MNKMEVEIKRDGLTLHGTLTKPDQDNFNLVILMHGFTANRNTELLNKLSEKFENLGMATLRFDFNGHGQSDGDFEDMTVLNEIADGKSILDYARSISGVKKIYLLGHSQGGVVASMLAGYYHDKIDKLVLMAPAATLKDDAIKGSTRGMTYDPNSIPDELDMGNGLILGGMYLRTAQSLPIYEISKLFTGPVCLIHGTDDKVVNDIASKRYDEAYQDDELHLLDGVDHRFSEPEKRQKAIDLVAEFLTKKGN
jgi:pimeloyl-ACP methyl ester carboxylesterase